MFKLTIREGYKAEVEFIFKSFDSLSVFLEKALFADEKGKYAYTITKVGDDRDEV